MATIVLNKTFTNKCNRKPDYCSNHHDCSTCPIWYGIWQEDVIDDMAREMSFFILRKISSNYKIEIIK